MSDARNAAGRARRSLLVPLNAALAGQTGPLDRWLGRLETAAQDQDGRAHPLLTMEHWTHHLPLNGPKDTMGAQAPLVALLETDLPASFKVRAIALTTTILHRTDPQTLLKWRYMGGVMEPTWLRAIDVPEVATFMRRHIPACRPDDPAREDWSLAFINVLLADDANDSRHHRWIGPSRRARLWNAAVDAGLVRDESLGESRPSLVTSRMPGFVRDAGQPGRAYTPLEWLVLNDDPHGLVDRWLLNHGHTPRWISPASGQSLVRAALSHGSPHLLDHWVGEDPSLLDAPLSGGPWHRRAEISAGSGIHLGGRYFSQDVLDRAQITSASPALPTWLNDPQPTLRTTLLLLGDTLFPVARTLAMEQGLPGTVPGHWERWTERFMLQRVIEAQPIQQGPRPPSRSRTRL